MHTVMLAGAQQCTMAWPAHMTWAQYQPGTAQLLDYKPAEATRPLRDLGKHTPCLSWASTAISMQPQGINVMVSRAPVWFASGAADPHSKPWASRRDSLWGDLQVVSGYPWHPCPSAATLGCQQQPCTSSLPRLQCSRLDALSHLMYERGPSQQAVDAALALSRPGLYAPTRCQGASWVYWGTNVASQQPQVGIAGF